MLAGLEQSTHACLHGASGPSVLTSEDQTACPGLGGQTELHSQLTHWGQRSWGDEMLMSAMGNTRIFQDSSSPSASNAWVLLCTWLM